MRWAKQMPGVSKVLEAGWSAAEFRDPTVPVQANAPSAGPFNPTEAQLVVASALGKMVFRWRLDGGPEAPPTAEPGSEQKPVTTPKP